MKSQKVAILTLILLFGLMFTASVVTATSGDSVNKFTGKLWNVIMMFLPFGLLMVVAYFLSELIPFLKNVLPF